MLYAFFWVIFWLVNFQKIQMPGNYPEESIQQQKSLIVLVGKSAVKYVEYAHVHEISFFNFNGAFLLCLLLIPGTVVICTIRQGCTNTGCQVTKLTKFCPGCQNNVSLGMTVPEDIERYLYLACYGAVLGPRACRGAEK